MANSAQLLNSMAVRVKKRAARYRSASSTVFLWSRVRKNSVPVTKALKATCTKMGARDPPRSADNKELAEDFVEDVR